MFLMNWKTVDSSKLFKCYSLPLTNYLESCNILPIAKNTIDEATNRKISVFAKCNDLSIALENWSKEREKLRAEYLKQ